MVGFARAGTGAMRSACPQGAGKLNFTVHQLITPETERSTHFFKLVHTDWPPAMRAHLDVFIDPVNREDVWACEEQQRMDDCRPGAQNALIPTDRAVVAMRRVLQRLQESESLVAPFR